MPNDGPTDGNPATVSRFRDDQQLRHFRIQNMGRAVVRIYKAKIARWEFVYTFGYEQRFAPQIAEFGFKGVRGSAGWYVV